MVDIESGFANVSVEDKNLPRSKRKCIGSFSNKNVVRKWGSLSKLWWERDTVIVVSFVEFSSRSTTAKLLAVAVALAGTVHYGTYV